MAASQICSTLAYTDTYFTIFFQLLTCKYVLPIMEGRGSGAIANVSSIAGIRWVGVPSISYAASKAAVIQFTQTIALQYAAKVIRANTIVLGVVRTPTHE